MTDRRDNIHDFDDSRDDSMPQELEWKKKNRDPIRDHDREREGDFTNPTIMRIERRMERLLVRQNRDIDERLTQRLADQTREIKKHIAGAFPDGDLYGHRVAHEKQIKTANKWDDIKTDFARRAFSGALLATVVFILMLVWEYVKVEIRK